MVGPLAPLPRPRPSGGRPSRLRLGPLPRLALPFALSACALVVALTVGHEVAHCVSWWARGGSAACEVTLYAPGSGVVCDAGACAAATLHPRMAVATARVGELPPWEHPLIYGLQALALVPYARWLHRRVERAFEDPCG